MAQTVTTRPSHYEALGLTPTASAEEIGRAFVREMSRPRAFGGITELSVAYETLRNPARRRAYDEAIGVTKPAARAPAVRPVALRAQAQFIAAPAAPARPMREEPQAEPQVEPLVEAKAEPALPSFLASALRELAEPAPLPPKEPARAASRQEPEAAPPPPPAPALNEIDEAEEGAAPQWKRIAIPAAGLIAVVGLIGAWAGWQSQGAAPVASKQAALLAPPTTFAVGDPAQAAEPDAVLDKGEPVAVTQPRRAHVARRRADRTRAPSHLSGIEAQLATPTDVAATEPAAAAQAVATEPAGVVAASMPLPNSVIARTINRIGYPCGSVASTSQILGKAFTVTCTSGHTYRAAPVNGRYHFRRVKS